jgi:polypeptide N-acetylgalactosaminyltransferase
MKHFDQCIFLSSGDLSAQFAIKKKYNCKSFKWFIENIAYDVPKRYPYPPPLIGWGEVSIP